MQAKLLNGDTLCALLDENAEGLVENGLQTQVLWLALGFGISWGEGVVQRRFVLVRKMPEKLRSGCRRSRGVKMLGS